MRVYAVCMCLRVSVYLSVCVLHAIDIYHSQRVGYGYMLCFNSALTVRTVFQINLINCFKENESR